MDPDAAPDRLLRIGFGGGCHWCTEAVFQSLRGVRCVAQGFISSEPPYDAWSEGVVVSFDPAEIDLAVLLEVHLRTHSSTSAHRLRAKYRSAVYVFDDGQAGEVRRLMEALQAGFEKPLVTKVLSYNDFRPSEERYQNYYRTDPDRPFSRCYIDPKLAVLRQRFAAHFSNPVVSDSRCDSGQG